MGGFKRFRKKAKELKPLTWRRLKKKRFTRLLKKKTGLRKRAGKKDYGEGSEEIKETVLSDIIEKEEAEKAAL
ncbi:MAG: hypothetical protein MUP63_02060 [Candidatus Nanohaloarchaeota archaeon QJJ-7]|nr:hypothetical protein [Candidatus Nanohaloarchaeota archaeon QJJ-7]